MVCFVILHYMATEETTACVKSIEENVQGEKKIIIIDNASPNASGKELQKIYQNSPITEVLLADSNLGFAKGNNLGYQHAVDRYHPDFIVVMNNDMEIRQTDFIQKIEESYQTYQFSILGPDVYSTKKEYHQNPQTRRILSLEELKKSYRKLTLKENLLFIVWLKWYLKSLLKKNNDTEEKRYHIPFVDEVKEGILLHGSCYIFSPLFLQKHPKECFYPETFMYMEAEILYYLAKKNGEKIIYDPSMKVDHHEDVSTDATFKGYQKSAFSIRCLRQSTKAFIDLIESQKTEEKSYE